jgi:hypothetical protein
MLTLVVGKTIMKKAFPIFLFVCVVATLLVEPAIKIWRAIKNVIHTVSTGEVFLKNQGQISGGQNSEFHKIIKHLDIGDDWTPILAIQAGITLIFVAASLFVILSQRYASTEKHWAFGALGTILGFWLRTT